MSTQPEYFSNEDHIYWMQFRQGDAAALGALAQKYYSTLFHYATRFSKESAFIEDCIQDVLLRLWDRRMYLRETPSVKFYLLKALRHQLVKSLQKKSLENYSLDEEQINNNEESLESQIISQEDWQLTSLLLQTHISGLSKRQQEALYLRYYENLSYEEIGQMMGIAPQSVANLLQYSLKKLRDCWPIMLWATFCYLIEF
ncbi:sigma-70 family RNA polymerase sigma factor [Xanthocytophaga agilis]|uniref:Sigma-70 family RNA polymerase sigma factor n=1 Tax=Xanthocytophaga agilis TaxID=3048010 RepID=A0AAE3UGU2_9BACT|nr:sigma-70 family RNA polymerase sigma factor [Xanthocytophaga agilis]MDJ1503656.1 sigma-70 family RNA polymerase sigma factor [Xanthocytophaga agilis]